MARATGPVVWREIQVSSSANFDLWTADAGQQCQVEWQESPVRDLLTVGHK